MSDTNTVLLEGNIAQDLELASSAAGNSYLRFGLAVNKSRRNSDGEWENEGHFFNVTAFGQTAENLAASAQKGTRVIVTGRLEQSKWETEDGEKRQAVGVIADSVSPSLRWATASVTKQSKGSNGSSPESVDAAVVQLEEAFGPI